MALFRNRPLASAFCCFLIASLIGVKLNANIKIMLLLLVLALAFFLAVFAICKRRCSIRLLGLILCLVAVSIGCFRSWLFFDVVVGRFSDLEGKEITVEGYVSEVKASSLFGAQYGVQLEEVDGNYVSAKALLECKYASSLQPGDRFRLTGSVRLPENTAAYEEESVLYSDGFIGIITCEDYQSCSILEGKVNSLKIWFSRIQKTLSYRLNRALGGEEGALASALFTGDRSYLSDDIVLAFRRGGVSHLLALSGLHISILFLMLDISLKILPLKKNPRTVLVLLGIGVYLLITGCSPSTLRAVVMLYTLYISYHIGYDYDGFTTLGAIAFLILIVSPGSIYDLSFWLSFVATAGILIFIPVVAEMYKSITKDREIPKKIRRIIWLVLNTLTVGFFANATILPLSAYLFGSTSVLSVALTIVLSPLISLALPCSALTLVFPSLPPITLLSKFIFQIILSIVSWSSELSNVIVLLDGSVTVMLWIALTICLAALAIVKLNQYKWLLLPLAMSVAVLVSGYADVLPKELGVVANYVSTGDEEALILAEGKNAVAVDFSSGSSEISRLICDTATELRCTELQELILTHYHSRSSSQIASICGQMKLRILRLPIPQNDHDAAIAARLEQEATLHGVKVLYGTDEPTLPQAQIFYYHASPPQDGAEGAVLFTMDIYGQRVCYMNGDAWKGEFAHLARDAALSSDLFIFGAHGRKYDVSADFFQNLQNTKQVIFGALEIYESCPRDALAAQYWVEIPTKQFSFQRTAHQ